MLCCGAVVACYKSTLEVAPRACVVYDVLSRGVFTSSEVALSGTIFRGRGPDSVADLDFVLGVSEWSQVTAMAVWGRFFSCKMSSSRK